MTVDKAAVRPDVAPASELPNTGAPVGKGDAAAGGLLVALGALLMSRSRRGTSRA
ncbi:MAG TPA: LPXTG cell wall anchor domain-containing protein [Nocardioidaceae bacterium]|nr:LPXTG cell wall anchor domain-containing protein [Nocardioidaceae bacterium]